MKRILKQLNPNKMVRIPNNISLEKGCEMLYWNLWHQFGLDADKIAKLHRKGKQLKVIDFAWTDEVSAAFYQHPYNRNFWKKLQRNSMYYGAWVLNVEPKLIN